MTKVPQPKRLGDFFVRLYYLGFANGQPIPYISNVEEYHVPTPPMITQMSIVLGLQMVNRFCILRVQTIREVTLTKT